MRTCLAFVAALCAFAVVATSPVPEDEPFRKDVDDALRPIEESVASVIKYLEDSDKSLKESIEEATNGELGVQKQVGYIHTSWDSGMIEKAAAEAQAAGIDVSECTDAWKDFLEKFDAEANMCLESFTKPMENAMAAYHPLLVEATALREEARAKAEECRQKGSSLAVKFCLVKNLVPLRVKAGGILAKATYWTIKSSFQTLVISMVQSCVGDKAQNKTEEADAIAKKAKTCIRNKLPNTL